MEEERMQFKSLKFPVIVMTIMFFLSQLIVFNPPPVMAQGSDIVDDRPVTITRKTKARRVHRPRKVVRRRRQPPVEQEQSLLLALQYRILKVTTEGEEEANLFTKFYPGDFLRLAVKANQSGYLYIIHQNSRDGDGQIIFPDSRLNNGQNYVSKDQEYVLPSNCPDISGAPPCAFPVVPPSGVEYFTLIFTRDMLIDLPNQAAESGGVIRAQVLQRLLGESGQKLSHKPGATRYAVKVINTNTRDNEEIIETLLLNKG